MDDGLHVWSYASRSLTPFDKSQAEEAVFSPDDCYVAFSSLEPVRYEVYVTTFPEHQQSLRKDGCEVLVATLPSHISTYPVRNEGGFTAGKPSLAQFVVDADGKVPAEWRPFAST